MKRGLWTRQYLNNTELSPNEQKEGKGQKWSLNELISYCVQEEERLKQERTENAPGCVRVSSED